MAKRMVGEAQRVNILENAVLATLRFSNLGNTGSVDAQKVDTGADKAALHVSKALLDSPEYRAIQTHRWTWRHRALARLSVPATLLAGTATCALPLAHLERAERVNEEFGRRDRELVDAFIAAYPRQVQAARERLKEEFRAEEYPPVSKVRAAFGVRYGYFALGTPDSLKGVSAAVHARETERFYADLGRLAQEIDAALTGELTEVFDWMVDRLSDRNDGKPKAFGKPFDEKLERIHEFFGLFRDRNLTGNSRLDAIVTKAQALLRGVSAEAVKGDRDFRKQVREGCAAVKATLNGMVEVRAARRVILED